jgi:hypothetical protein
VAARELDEEGDDDRKDHGEAGERGRVDVNLAEALVACVAAQTAHRLAAPAEQHQQPEAGQDPKRDESAAGSPPIHCAMNTITPSATANSGMNHFDLVICIEHLLDGGVEKTGQGEGERQRGV